MIPRHDILTAAAVDAQLLEQLEEDEAPIPPIEASELREIPRTAASDRQRRTNSVKKPGDYYKAHTGKKNLPKGYNLVNVLDAVTVLPEKSYTQYCLSSLKATTIATAMPAVPKTYNQSKKHVDFCAKWLPAMQRQLDALIANKTWKLVNPPKDADVLPGKWVYDEKYPIDAEPSPRARWVVCGNYEKDNWANQDVYAAVANLTTIKVFLCISATQNHIIWQYDFCTAFLNSKILRGTFVYVRQPHGLRQVSGKVCLLLKALYGLRKAGIYWLQTLVPVMKEIGFEVFRPDFCLFINKKTGALVVLYVDDMLVSASTMEAITETRVELEKRFKLKDLGEAKSFLGFDIKRDRENYRIYLSQERYVRNILDQYGYTDCNGVASPWPTSLELPKVWDPDKVTQPEYIKKTGKLNYLAVGTRCDITYTVSRLCEANNGPSAAHLQLLAHLFRYLKKTVRLSLAFGGKLPIDRLGLCCDIKVTLSQRHEVEDGERTRAAIHQSRYPPALSIARRRINIGENEERKGAETTSKEQTKRAICQRAKRQRLSATSTKDGTKRVRMFGKIKTRV